MAGKFVCTNTEPIVETKQGKLRGFCLNGIYTFHGVHYAEADRFQMPHEVEPWEGVRMHIPMDMYVRYYSRMSRIWNFSFRIVTGSWMNIARI